AFLELDGEYRGIVLGGAIAVTIGVADDFRRWPWWGTLGGQVAAAAVAIGFGVTIDRFTFPYVTNPYLELPGWVGAPATLIWIVAMMNMVNFLDGLDGLAAGICGLQRRSLPPPRHLARH